MSRSPRIEVLYFDGCPSYERLLPTVGRLAQESGAELALRRVETPEQAEVEQFLGSPTVRVDGADVEPSARQRTDYGLKCRLFRSADRQSPVPPMEWIRAALGVTNASARATVERVLGDDRWAADRLAGLALAERALYASILRRFAEGRVSEPPPSGGTDSALRTLAERDLVGLDASGHMAVAYPFSAQPTRLRVRVDDGRSYWAMCAIDALGIPFLVGESAEVEGRDPGSGLPIRVAIDVAATMPRWTPADAVVLVARSGTGCASGCACPHIDFFGSAEAAERYLARPELDGGILTVPDAADTGRRLFGGLLDRLVS